MCHKLLLKVFSFIPLFICFIPSGWAATVLEYQSTPADSSASVSSQRIVIKGNRAAVYKDANSKQIDLIYNLDTNNFQFLNHHERYYTEISISWLKQAREKQHQMRREIEANFENNQKKMTPEQRLAYQQGRMGMKMMPGMMNNFNSSLKKTYIGGFVFRTINDRRCRVVGIRRGNIYLYDLCLADNSNLGINEQDYKVINAMLSSAVMMEDLGLNQYGFRFPRFINSGGRYTGVPISIASPNNKPPITLLVSIHKQESEHELLAPEHYIRSEIPLPNF